MTTSFRYETPVETVKNVTGKVIFLAGPTVRGNQLHLQPSWRYKAEEIFQKSNFDGTIIIPEFTSNTESDKGKFDIPLWENEGLKRADVIIFWIARTRELIALTTNFEFGYWIVKDREKLVYGRPDDAYRISYDDIMWLQHGKEVESNNLAIYSTLEDTIAAAIEKVNTRISIDDYYIDCGYHPLICTEIDEANDEIIGESIIDGMERQCSIYNCAPQKTTKEKAEELKKIWLEQGEYGVLLYRGWSEEAARKFMKEWR